MSRSLIPLVRMLVLTLGFGREMERIDPQHATRLVNLFLQFLSSIIRIDEACRRTFE